MSLPSSATLLAAPHPSNEPAPIYVRLTSDALANIRNGVPMRLSVDDRTATFKMGEHVYEGSITKEPGSLEVYTMADQPGRFRSAGMVQQRVLLRPPMANPAQRASTATNAKRPSTAPAGSSSGISSGNSNASSAGNSSGIATSSSSKKPVGLNLSTLSPPRGHSRSRSSSSSHSHSNSSSGSESSGGEPLKVPPPKLANAPLVSPPMRISHLLALGKATASSLASRTQVPLPEVRGLLEHLARPVAEGKKGAYDLFILKPEIYEKLRIHEWKHYSSKEREQVAKDAEKAFDMLKYPPDHSARKNLLDAKGRTGLAGSPAPEKRNGALSAQAKRKLGLGTAISTTKNPLKRAKIDEQDLHSMARKFKDTYGEYARLYNVLSSGPRPPSQVQRLLSLHKDLAGWKEQLWSASKQRKLASK